MSTLLGKHLQTYRVVELIRGPPGEEAASSARSQIYIAIDRVSEQRVIIKLFSTVSLSSGGVDELRSSMRKVAQIKHPGVPPILGSGMAAGRPYVVTPYLEAGSLADRYASGLVGSLDPSNLLNELADTLDHVHTRRVFHGAIRPSSLLFDEESGGVRLVGLGESSVRSVASAGTEGIYSAPEVPAGTPPSAASDQYSFGILALELLTRIPADQALMELQAQSVGKKGAEDLKLNDQAVLVLSKATAVDPAQRFDTVGEANRALQIALGYLRPVVAPSPKPQPASSARKPRRLRFGLAAMAILLLGLVCTIPAFSAGLIKLPGAGSDGVSEPTNSSLPAGSEIPLPTEDAGLPGSPGPGSDEEDPSPELLLTEDSGGAVSKQATDSGGSPAGDPGPAPTSTETVPSTTSTPTQLPTSTPTAPTPIASDTPLPTVTVQLPTNTPAPATEEPTPNSKKCKDDPSHPNYCTPTPTG